MTVGWDWTLCVEFVCVNSKETLMVIHHTLWRYRRLIPDPTHRYVTISKLNCMATPWNTCNSLFLVFGLLFHVWECFLFGRMQVRFRKFPKPIKWTQNGAQCPDVEVTFGVSGKWKIEIDLNRIGFQHSNLPESITQKETWVVICCLVQQPEFGDCSLRDDNTSSLTREKK